MSGAAASAGGVQPTSAPPSADPDPAVLCWLLDGGGDAFVAEATGAALHQARIDALAKRILADGLVAEGRAAGIVD